MTTLKGMTVTYPALFADGALTPVLLQGHPTRVDLAAGIGKKRGLPVSEHNVWCDRACGEAAAQYVGSAR